MPAVAEILLRPEGQALYPVTQHDAELIEGLPNKSYPATLSDARSLPHNRKYWALLGDYLRNTALGDRYATKEALHKALLLASGHVTEIAKLDGELVLVPDSTAFNRMSQATFNKYYRKAESLMIQATGAVMENER